MMDTLRDDSPPALIVRLAAEGITLACEDGALKVRSTHASVADATLTLLREHKQSLLAHLAGAAPEHVASGQQVYATSSQQRFWWLSDSEGGDPYAIVAAYRIDGPLDADAWEAACATVMQRHAAFSTVFSVRDGALYQAFGLAPIPALARDALAPQQLDGLCERYAATLSLLDGAPVRHGLHRIGPDEHVYVLACHHAVLDGRSLEVYFGELAQVYAAHLAGAPGAPAARPVQFIDHAARLATQGAGHVKPSLDYWLSQLDGIGRQWRWPAPPAHPGPDGTLRAALPASLAQRLDQYARGADASRFSVLYSAYKLLLSKTCGAHDFAIGHPVSNRPDEAMQGAIGCFTNTIMLRARIDPQASFASYVTQVQAENIDSLAYQDAPLEQVTAGLNAVQGEEGTLMQSLFAVQHSTLPSVAGAAVARLPLRGGRAKFPLSLMVDYADAQVTLHWEYAGQALGEADAGALHARFLHLLEAALDAPHLALERLQCWSGPENMTLPDAHEYGDIVSRFRSVAQQQSAHLALRCGLRQYSYAELDAHSDAIAALLQQTGAAPGQFVGMLLAPGLERAAALLGILKAGAAYVPLAADWSEARQHELRARLDLRICLGRPGAVWAGLACLDPGCAVPGAQPADLGGRGAQSAAYVNFSSGTTGVPKAIACTDAGVVRLVTGQRYAEFNASLVMLNAAPLDFDAFTLEFWAPLLNGGVCVLLDDSMLSPALLRQAIERDHVNAAWLTSALFNTLADLDPDAFAGLRQLLVGGDVVSPEHVARLYARHPELRIINGYGPTENTTFSACFPIPRDWPAARPLPIGRAIAGSAALVVDLDGNPAPPGVIGELLLAGAGLALAYVGQPELSAQSFQQRQLGQAMWRCYRSGDLAYTCADGLLHFCGRRDRQIKFNGFRIELAGIDNVLRSHAQVNDAITLLVQRGAAAQLLSFVVPASGTSNWRGALEQHLQLHLASYQQPSELVELAALPLTGNGKVDRKQLELLCQVEGGAQAAGVLSAGEALVAQVWSELLGRTIEQPHAHFFRSGGSSLLAMRLLARLNSRCGIVLRFADLVQAPTVRALALRIDAATPKSDVALANLAAAPLSPRQQLLWNQFRLAPSDTRYNVPSAYTLHGPLDATRLVEAITRVYNAHASLQARFVAMDSNLQQRRVDAPEWRVETVATSESEVATWIGAEARRQFDLEHGPVFVARLLAIAPTHHVLQLNFSHIIIDGWSFNLVWESIQALYRDPGSTVTASGFEGYLAANADQQADTAYWLARLDGCPPLALQGPHGALEGALSAELHSTLTDTEAQALRRYAADAAVSTFAAAYAAFGLLLNRWLGQSRLVVSTPFANRDRPGAAGWVGYYAAMLPVDFETPAGLCARDYAVALQATLHAAMAHPELDMDQLLRGLRLDAGRDGNPLQRAVFAWQEGMPLQGRLGQADFVRMASPPEPAKFPLMLTACANGDGIALLWSFASDLVAAADIELLDRAYRALLVALAGAPGAALDQVSAPIACPAPPAQDEMARPAQSAPGVAGMVRAAWESVLALPVAGEDPHFFRLGGNSLLCLRVQAELARTHRIDVALATLLRYPVLSQLAARISQAGTGAPGLAPSAPPAPGQVMPLTSEQQRLWFLHCLRPSSAYNVPLLFEVTDGYDGARLQCTLRALLARHVALRLRIGAGDGTAHQAAADCTDFTLHTVMLSQAGFEAHLRLESAHVFDLERDGALRACAMQLEDGRAFLLLNIHHLFFDGQSLAVLRHDLNALYQGQALPAQAHDFGAVVAWQQSNQYRATVEADIAYWRARLHGAPQESMLPPDTDLPAMRGVAGTSRAALPDGTLARVRSLARSLGCSEFAFWLGVTGLALGRMTQQDEFVLATPAANRQRTEFHDVVGFITNTLALRLTMPHTDSVQQYLATLFERLGDDLAHQACPLDAIGGARPDEFMPPWSQVLFTVFDTDPGDSTDLLRQRPLGNAAAKYPLAVSVAIEGDNAGLMLEYDCGRYSGFLVGNVAAAIVHVIGQVLDAPVMPLGQVALAPSVPVQATQDEQFIPITELIRRAGERTPHALAIHGPALTHGDLWPKVERYGAALRRGGARQGGRIGILMHRSEQLPVLLLAVLALGATYVPLDPNYPQERIAYILADSCPDLVVTDDEALAAVLGIAQPVLALTSLDQGGPAEALAPSGCAADDLAYIIYTSGSTGRPKGVAIRHESLYWLHLWAGQTYSGDDLRNVLAATSICFDLSVFEIFMTWSLGGGITVAENVLALIDDPRAGAVTLINTVPSLLEETLRHAGLPAALRAVNLAGEPLQRSLAAKVAALKPAVRVYNLYGPSEDTTYSTAALIDPAGEGPVSIGTPLCGTRALVLDEQRRPLPDGVPGELYLGGRGLAAGYFGQPELTAERFIDAPDGHGRLYRTGDKVRRMPGGELAYLGRLDHQCKLRGYRIELGEIERVLSEHPSVRDNCVLACELGSPEARLVAFVTASGPDFAAAELKPWLVTMLPSYMVPSQFVELASLPLTPSGKIDRIALQAHIPTAGHAPATELELWFMQQMAELLAVERVDIDESLLMLGGSAPEIAGLQAAIETHHAVRIDFARLMEAATPRALALEVAAALASHAASETDMLVI